MHGRKRAEYKHRFQDDAVVKALGQKAQQWYTLSKTVLDLRQQQQPKVENVSETGDSNGTSTAIASMGKALPLLDKMLRVNPDPLHLWNHRRESLLLQQTEHSFPSDTLQGELHLTAAALEKNPKAYGAWSHRKWVLQQFLQAQSIITGNRSNNNNNDTHKQSLTLLEQELALTALFLQRDERNFHCWNFRRFLVGLELELTSASSITNLKLDGGWRGSLWDATNDTADNNSQFIIGPQITSTSHSSSENDGSNTNTINLQPQQELKVKSILQREWDFTQTKIVENFSNFSAFHYRGKLLLLVRKDGGWSPQLSTTDGTNDNDNKPTMMQTIAEHEWKLMENIMFTEPDDQTIWWYHRFVLDWLQTDLIQSPQDEEWAQVDWYVPWLEQQAETLQVLVEDEPECKWAWLGYHLVLERLMRSSGPDGEGKTRDDYKAKLQSALDTLVGIDPDRTLRYQAMKEQIMKG